VDVGKAVDTAKNVVSGVADKAEDVIDSITPW
jgi:hypothetical protein